jgi:serine/threonine-protein kinase
VLVCPSCNATFREADARFCGECGQALVLAPDPYAGMILNRRFQLETRIGEGSFGVVYRASQLETGRSVAVKLLHPELNQDANRVARFRREGLVLCNLRNAHTITVFDFDQSAEGVLYIAMELLEGKSLEQVYYEQAPLDWRRAFRILMQICSSLGEAHAQGIVHRDLKPENIYLEDRARNHDFVKVLDFGIAKLITGDPSGPMNPQLTATGQTLGTLEYMAPEQLMGKALDGRSDIYALGVLGYELITGSLPFPNATDTLSLITAQLKRRPMAPSQLLPASGLPTAGDALLLKCLERDKVNRYPDAMALAAALLEVVGR